MSKETKKEVSVFAPDGTYIRTYSEKVQGKGYKELAKEFAGKVAGRKVKAGEEKAKAKEESEPEEVDLTKLSLKELKKAAKEKGIDAEKLNKKADVIKLIEDAEKE